MHEDSTLLKSFPLFLLFPGPNVKVAYEKGLRFYYMLSVAPSISTVLVTEKLTHLTEEKEIIYTNSRIINTGNENTISVPLHITARGIQAGPYTLKISAEFDSVFMEKDLTFHLMWENQPFLNRPFDKVISQMKYILLPDQYKRLESFNKEDRKQEFYKYWNQISPTDSSEQNELLNEYFYRVDFADQNFSSNLKSGWKTDRGKIFMLYGLPDTINKYYNDFNRPPYEIWVYYNLRSRYTFVDRFRNGEFNLTREETE